MSMTRFDSFSVLKGFSGRSLRATIELRESNSECMVSGELKVDPSGRSVEVERVGALRLSFSDVETFTLDTNVAGAGTAELNAAIGISFAKITLRNGFTIRFLNDF